MKISIRVKAGSRQNKLAFENEELVIRVNAPAQEGKANEELIRFLAKLLGIPKSGIEIVSGHSSPYKRLNLPDEAGRKLMELAAD